MGINYVAEYTQLYNGYEQEGSTASFNKDDWPEKPEKPFPILLALP